MQRLRIKLYDLLLCLSNALELISPRLYNHHQQVAYLSYVIAQNAGIPFEKRKNLFYASLIHDIGALTAIERLDITETENISITYHGFRGKKLLDGFEPLQEASDLIKFHHMPWDYSKGLMFNDEQVYPESHIVHLADRVCMSFNTQENILSQVNNVLAYAKANKGKLFNPDYVDVLQSIAKKEYIWLDLFSRFPIEKIPELNMYGETLLMTDQVLEFTHLISQVIDFKSRFTSCHSAGVAITAEKLSSIMHFSQTECMMMMIAGYLHDLGKLAISNNILDKPGKLDYDEYREIKKHTYYTYHLLSYVPQFSIIREWAAYHHEKLNGNGYPFHIKRDNLSLGSRIMAVADIFTAITEDRPYRKGMEKEEVKKLLTTMVSNDELDEYVVKILFDNFDYISMLRMGAQRDAYDKFTKFSESF